MNYIKKAMLSSTVLTGLLLIAPGLAATPAFAADADAAAAADAGASIPGDIIVTARKRQENALDVPVAITAFTGEDLLNRDIKTLADLSAFTPSLTVDTASAGGARVDRSQQLLIIRGMNPSSTLNPTTSVFLNGVPLGGSDFLQNLDDVEHVEVLKGPQSAYFGRETFAGALNVVARSAGNTFSFDGFATAATRNTYTTSANVTVPIIDNVLSIRVGATYDTRDGSYSNANNPHEKLGNQETKSAHVAVTFKPADNLTIKAYALTFKDEDGAPADGLLLANGPAAFNQSNCKVGFATYFCHTLPGLIGGVSPAQADTVYPGMQKFFANPGGLMSASDTIHHFGLKRLGTHADLSIEYAIPDSGVTLSYLGGVNYDNWSSISDLANIDTQPNGQYPGYVGLGFPAGSKGFPFLVESRKHDFSQEVRVSSDPKKRLRILVGASYLKAYTESINSLISGGPVAVGAPALSETTGGFFSLGFDILSNLTLTAEGRYQADKEISDNVAHAVVVQGTSHNFLPRVSLQFKPTPKTMVYATYSKGVNPGLFNTQYNTLPAVSQAKINAVGAGGLVVKPETLDNYEIGFKGRFFDNRVTVTIAAYYDKWKNQIQAGLYNFAPDDPANPYNVPTFSQYNKANNSIYQYLSNSNAASSTAKGIEFEATIVPVRYLTISMSGAINDTKYDNFICTSCAGYSAASPFVANGKRLPNAPEFSSAVSGQYEHPITMGGATSVFARVDYLYHSGLFINASNTAKTQQSNTVNLRAGINFEHVSFEGFVNNVLNNRAYTTAFDSVNFAGGFAPAAVVGLPNLITGGVRVRVKL